MSALDSKVNRQSPEFRKNAEAMGALVADLRAKVAAVEQGGGPRACAKHTERGKLLPRDRIRLLLDVGAPFLELSQLAEHGMYGGEVPSAGILTGIGRVSGRECMGVCGEQGYRVRREHLARNSIDWARLNLRDRMLKRP